jgi:hypothetical protein
MKRWLLVAVVVAVGLMAIGTLAMAGVCPITPHCPC